MGSPPPIVGLEPTPPAVHSPDRMPSGEIAAYTRRMVRGEEAAYRWFYEAYFDRLLRYLLVLTSGQEDSARELVQQTLLRVVRYIKPFDSEAALWSWLTVLARSAFIDDHRKHRRYRAVLDRFFHQENTPTLPSPAAAEEVMQERLEQGLARLEAGEHELLDRKYTQGQSVAEIARDCQTTEKTIESRLVRIRRKLKDLILNPLSSDHEP